MNFKIGMAAKQLGINAATIRVLEKRGVITARRDWAGYRVFTENELREIEKILFNGKVKNRDR